MVVSAVVSRARAAAIVNFVSHETASTLLLIRAADAAGGNKQRTRNNGAAGIKCGVTRTTLEMHDDEPPQELLRLY